MRPKKREAMEMLFIAKWNLPKAAEYCNFHPKTYEIS
jgi:hypothetical protein